VQTTSINGVSSILVVDTTKNPDNCKLVVIVSKVLLSSSKVDASGKGSFKINLPLSFNILNTSSKNIVL